MLVLMCRAGGRRYAIDSREVVEVVAYAKLQPISQAPGWVAGVFAYRGRPTPVADLSLLTLGQRCPLRWSTRIVITRLAADGAQRLIGLLVEQVVTAELDHAATSHPRQELSDISPLGPLLLDDEGVFQLMELPRLLSLDRQRALFPPAPDND